MKIRLLATAILCLLGIVTPSTSVGQHPDLTLPAAAGPRLFKLVRTVQVAPDDMFATGGFARINYVPATNRFLVTFGAKARFGLAAGYAFKEYDMGMNETGRKGFFARVPDGFEAGDSGSVMVDNDYYFAWMGPSTPGFPYGWQLIKYDAVTMQELDNITVPLDDNIEANNDPMVAFVNGQIDVSSQSNPPPLFLEGTSTHHNFFSLDLEPRGKMLLWYPPHICGSSMIYVDGVYYFVTAESFLGSLHVFGYDTNWNYLGEKLLSEHGHWSQGIAFEGERFFVAYLDTSRWRNPDVDHALPPALNVHLAAFDREWNILEDVAVTDFTLSDYQLAGRPWVVLHNRRAYVSFDVDSLNPDPIGELGQSRAYVAVYEVRP